MSSNFSIEEIVLINNLLYCENLGGPRGTFLSSSYESRTIGDYVNKVLRNAAEIENDKEYSTGVTGAEYKEILWAIRPNNHLKNVIIKQVHYESDDVGGGRSVYLFDPSTNEAVIAFKGTQSNAEWIDNVSGLYQVPTAFQQNALNWFKSLDFDGCDTITVTGHSKGGNKSKFITIMDDAVDNCFSFDGQGFSDEFIKKYAPQIRRNQWKIHNIIAESDFVNILLNDVGEKVFYLGTNYGRLGFAENHCANAIVFYDDIGGMSVWKAPAQDKKMADLDMMLNSFIRSCRMSTRENIAGMLGNVIVSAKTSDTQKLFSIFSDEKYMDAASRLMAFTLRYKGEKPQIIASVKEIMKQNGIDTGMVGLIDFITNYDILMEVIGKKPDMVISILKMKNAPKEAVAFLSEHKELFDFVVLVAKKMRKINPLKYNGEDLRPEDDWLFYNDNRRYSISRRRLSMLVFIAVFFAIMAVLILYLR
ncbi:MAG: DUF2974 domain-containing protein [Butyrivibrio sp.]|nr:DUF2974 domain-containing protein [Butyrivibrio sp.]